MPVDLSFVRAKHAKSCARYWKERNRWSKRDSILLKKDSKWNAVGFKYYFKR